MSAKNNVNPGQYKAAGREKPDDMARERMKSSAKERMKSSRQEPARGQAKKKRSKSPTTRQK